MTPSLPPSSTAESDIKSDIIASQATGFVFPPPPPLRRPTSSSSSKSKPRTSWIYLHIPGPPESKYYNSSGNLYWSCKYCSSETTEKLFRLDNSTNQITTHLANLHRIQKDSSLSLKEVQCNQKIQDALKRATKSSAESKRRRIYTELNTEQLKQLVVIWLASCSVSFRIVENIHFRNLLIFLNSDVKEILPESHKTIRK